MMSDYHEGPFSTEIEELDVDGRPSRAERLYRLESFLGALLILALLVVVGWYWIDQQGKQAQYRAGERAAAAGDWWSAHASYAAATGYADADKRAAEADRMLMYTSALSGTVALRPSASPPGLYYY